MYFRFFKDIIGEVYALGRIQTVQVHDKDRKRIQFRMRDTNGLDVACCLWGKYAEQFEAHIETGNDLMLICLIRFAKINISRGSIQITNAFDASVATLNPIMKEAIDFKQKLLEDDLPLSIYDKKNDKKMSKMQVDDWNEIEVKAISEILVAYEVLYIRSSKWSSGSLHRQALQQLGCIQQGELEKLTRF
ncbi:hypothetical protein Bca52824_066216 [Brassica carinata]|uniref:Uncharacterized protein n=1 Tax=Brassica carinata TaxID=52824 RepID=A0A8X7QK22_BRACI|nr:hypothetical protein Bca52824_066216 [Brassica carinata]